MVREPNGRQVVFDAGSHLHLARRRPWMLERLEASRLAVLAPDVHDDDPVPLRERYYRQHLDSSRWLRVVVDFGSEPAWVVNVTVQDSDPRE